MLVEWIGAVHIKLFDEMIRELKDVRYVSQLHKNLISVGALKVQGLRGTLEERVLKISSGSLVVLKGIRRNNLYYMMGSTANEKFGCYRTFGRRLYQVMTDEASTSWFELLKNIYKVRVIGRCIYLQI